MSLSAVKREELKPVFEALEEAFQVCGIDYYLIGALAREVWYAKAERKFRTTKDVDFAIMVGSNEQYEQVLTYLEKHKNYRRSGTNAFVLFAPDGIAVDLLPFGAVEIDDGVKLEGEGLTSIKVNGFMEVYRAGTVETEVLEGHSFEVATLPAIALLKLIAYDDRPEQRLKDARDIANILLHYFELEADLIYDQHNDLFAEDQPERDLKQVAAIVIGREMRKLLVHNVVLYGRVADILQRLIEKAEKSDFIRNMARETDGTIEEMSLLLQGVLTGMQDTEDS